MAVIKYNTGDGGTNGTAVTTGNSGGASGDAWGNVVGGTNVWTFTNTPTVKGGMAYKCVQAASTVAGLQLDFPSSQATHYGRAYVYLTSFATASHPIIKAFGPAFANGWRIDLTQTGQVRVRDAGGTLLSTSTGTITTGTWWRYEWKVVSGTGTSGQITVNVYSGDTTTAAITYTNAACNTGVSTDNIQFGPSLSTPQVPTLYIDEVSTNSANYPGPANVTNQAPTANAGPDQNIVQGSTVTLTGTASSDSDGTIASYSWSQLSGTTVSLTNPTTTHPTFTAPVAPATLVFQLTVTDNQGATGSDTVTINIDSNYIKHNTAEGGSNGTAVSIANSGGLSGSAWTGMNSLTAWTYTTTNIARGNLAYRCAQNVSEAAPLTWDVSALTEYYGRAYFYFTAFPSATQIIIRGWQDDNFTLEACRIDLLNNGTIRLRDGNTNSLYLSATSLIPGVWYRFEWHIVSGATNGTAELKVFTADQSTPLFSYSNSACNTGSVTAHVSVGPGSGSVQLPTMYMDDVALNANGWIGSAPGTALNSPPTANAGPDQNTSFTGNVTLNGSASTDPDGSIASYAWTQTSGTAVTLSSASAAQPTFTAPGSASTLVFQLTVTDNQGATGSDTVTIHVLPNIVYQYTAEGGTDGTAVTVGNSGGASGNAFTAVTGGTNVWTYSNAHSVRGSLALKCAPLVSTAAATQWQPSALTEHYGRMYFFLSGYAVGSEPLVKTFHDSFANAWRIELSAAGKMVVRDANTTALYTSTTPVSIGIWYRLEWHVASSTTTGQIEARLYIGDQLTLFDSYSSSAAQNIGPHTNAVQFGPSQSVSTAAPASYYDELALGTASGGWLGIAAGTPLNQAPSADAGPDDTAEPSTTYTLAGAGTDDVGVTSYQWVQLSGPTVTLSNATAQNPNFTTPLVQGGTSLTFGLTVVDNGGLSSPQDTVTITVLPPTIFYAKSGTWQPSA